MSSTLPPTRYAGWSRDQLLERLLLLEGQETVPENKSEPLNIQDKPKPTRKFNYYEYPRRKIALRFCYSGWEYGGLAFQVGDTPLPTVEGVLFDALAKARLVDPEAGFEGCGWERCGRTDRGVSGAGQVVSVWVRSALPAEELEEVAVGPPVVSKSVDEGSAVEEEEPAPVPDGIQRKIPKPQSRNENDYVSILNRMLPATIRVIAWSPVSSAFSARFSCQWRHYKYFFSPQGLDIPRMQEAASRLEGEHDFRNLCKLDAAKQITSFKRNVHSAYVEQLNDNLHVFNLIGSAFLYHQVRHIMAILFLVGTGLEPSSLITSLLNVAEGSETPRDGDPPLPIVDRKPEYQMVDGIPLMLWDCGYPEGTFTWRTTGRPDYTEFRDDGELQRELQNIIMRSHIFAALNEHFLHAISKHHSAPKSIFPLDQPSQLNERRSSGDGIQVPLGGGTSKRVVKYKPVLDRQRIDSVEVANERWRLGKGFRKNERRQAVVEAELLKNSVRAGGES